MSNVASFRELKGVGRATEAKLHEAGVYTWEALSEVLDALGNVRGSTGDTLRELSEQVASRSAAGDAAVLRLPTGERSEAFIVRMSLAPDGQPTRSSVTHVRTYSEKPLAGWSPGEVVHFIEEQSGLAAGPRPVAVAEPGGQPAPARSPAGSREHFLVLDAGKAIGGARRSIELLVSTALMADVAEFEYRATLAGSAYGQPPGTGPSWTALAERTGRSHPPDRLPLRFDAVELPQGLQRLRLEMALRLPLPRREAPALELR